MPGTRNEYQVLRDEKNEAEEFFKKVATPKAQLDKEIKEQRESRKNVLLEFENKLKPLNKNNEKIKNEIKIKNNEKIKKGYLTMMDKEKNEEYKRFDSDYNSLITQKNMVDEQITSLKKEKENKLKIINDKMKELKAKDQKLGGKKTRKRRTKNMKRRQTRKYKV